MTCDPTGAARTAGVSAFSQCPSSEELDALLVNLGNVAPEDQAEIAYLLRLQHAATLSHLAGQAGPEVRGLVERVEAFSGALDSINGESPAPGNMERDWRHRKRECIKELESARTALLAAYAAKDAEAAALRQQLDEAVRDRNYWRSTAAGERAEAASERQRAERAEARLKECGAKYADGIPPLVWDGDEESEDRR